MDERVLERLERLGQLRADSLRIRLVGDDHVFPIDKAIRPRGVARTRRRHRWQLQHVFLAHAASYCAVQPPSMGSMAPVIDLASSPQRNETRPEISATVTKRLVGCAASSTLRTTSSSEMPRALACSGI